MNANPFQAGFRDWLTESPPFWDLLLNVNGKEYKTHQLIMSFGSKLIDSTLRTTRAKDNQLLMPSEVKKGEMQTQSSFSPSDSNPTCLQSFQERYDFLCIPKPETQVQLRSYFIEMWITLHDPTNHFPTLLRFLYEGELKLTMENCVAILSLAEQLEVEELRNMCHQFLITSLNKETAPDVLERGFLLRSPDVIRHCITILARNFSYFVENHFDFRRLPLPAMLQLLNHESLFIASEDDVYYTVTRYLEKFPTHELREPLLSSLFKTVHFAYLEYNTLEEAMKNPLVPKALLSDALMIRLASHESPQYTWDDSSHLTASTSQSNDHQQTAQSRRRASYGRAFEYSGHDFDRNGVFYWLATSGGKEPWCNPALWRHPNTIVSTPSPSTTHSHVSTSTALSNSPLVVSSTHQSVSVSSSSPPSSPPAQLSISSTHLSETTNNIMTRNYNSHQSIQWNATQLAMFGPKVHVTSSSTEKGEPWYCLELVPREFWTQDVPSSWIQIDFGPQRLLKPTHYTLRHGSNSKQDCLRNWVLKASTDATNWEVLMRHIGDESLNSNFATHTWEIRNCTKAYRYFRIVQTGHNSSYHNFLSISGIEFYGQLYMNPTSSAKGNLSYKV